MDRLNVGKIQLNHKVGLQVDDGIKIKSLREWILNDPVRVYRHIYVAHKFNYPSISVVRDAIILLKKELNKEHPDIVKRIEDRRKLRKKI